MSPAPPQVDHRKCWCGGSVITTPGAPPVSKCVDGPTHAPFATGIRERCSKLYVAGPMTGLPGSNYMAFNQASELLRHVGYEVVNPAEVSLDRQVDVHYVDFIREDLRQMLDCHGVAVLDGWWNSSGARNEVNVAGLLKMEVRTVDKWLQPSMYRHHLSKEN